MSQIRFALLRLSIRPVGRGHGITMGRYFPFYYVIQNVGALIFMNIMLYGYLRFV